MIALDTNILLRFVLDDNAGLSPVARRIVERNECWVSLLAAGELGYVLTSVYRSNSAEVISYCRILMDLPTIAVEHERRFAQALDGVEAGIDWFDAMLWASAPADQSCSLLIKRFPNARLRLAGTCKCACLKPAPNRVWQI